MNKQLEISKLRVRYALELSRLSHIKKELESVNSQIRDLKYKMDYLEVYPDLCLEHEIFMNRINQEWKSYISTKPVNLKEQLIVVNTL